VNEFIGKHFTCLFCSEVSQVSLGIVSHYENNVFAWPSSFSMAQQFLLFVYMLHFIVLQVRFPRGVGPHHKEIRVIVMPSYGGVKVLHVLYFTLPWSTYRSAKVVAPARCPSLQREGKVEKPHFVILGPRIQGRES
jgi:hypothetical protein